MPDEKKLTKEEIVKTNSNHLRGTIKEELSKNTTHFEETDNKLLKFHGIYQQDDRDKRPELTASGKERAFSFMIRTKLPGGELTSSQYLGLNEICEKYTNKTLRVTTRQTIQFHGIIKGNLKATLKEINQNLINTYGACGDVVRNIMAPPVSDIDSEYSIDLCKLARDLSEHLVPNTRSYYEVWIDEEKIDLGGKDEEPLYGKTYLPRKFKIGITYPWDNSIDLFTQDVGIVVVEGGFNILIGGGLGHHHNKPETYPRLASEFCFVKSENLTKVVESIVLVQRDFGGRENRKHARMKYLVDDNGLDWFKSEVEKRTGFKLDPVKEIKEYKSRDYLGWHKQKNGNWYIGLFVENGRIYDGADKQIKSGLKQITEKFNVGVRLTPQQNVILTNIKEEDKSKIDEIIKKSSISTENTVSALRRNSMACVSLPTCGLALAEAERYLPKVITELEKLGYGEEATTIRMSGCPNSCSRPPVAEVGIIGLSANKYNIYVGGDFDGERLNKVYLEGVGSNGLVTEIEKLFKIYRTKRNSNERFGDFCNRVGVEKLKES
jgi:sulfite reductase (ferredoxin)